MKFLRLLLFPLAPIYGLVVYIRNIMFNTGFLKSTEFDLPIICIGNLSTGGTGKTPHTEYLIKLLSNQYNVAVLSRGYRRKTKDFRIASSRSSAFEIGDEPRQMKQKFSYVTIAVDGDRCNGVRNILNRRPNTEVILLDDAFQHRYIQADISILLTDYNNLYTKDYLLPVGNLRESRAGMKRARFIVITKCPPNITAFQRRQITNSVKLKKHQQIFFTSYKYKNLVNIKDQSLEIDPLKIIDERTGVLLVTGIANPKPLKQYLRNFTPMVKHLAFSDHHMFSARDIENITNAFSSIKQNRKFIITTEKDAQRLSKIMKASHEYIYYLPIEVVFIDDNEELFNNQIIKHVSSNRKYSTVYKGEYGI